MKIVPITPTNSHIFKVFEQDYEAEFSALTKKEPNIEGRFTIEADWRDPNMGFYLFIKEKPAGFAIRVLIDGCSDIAEFYILPCYRKKAWEKDLLLRFLICSKALGKYAKFLLLKRLLFFGEPSFMNTRMAIIKRI